MSKFKKPTSSAPYLLARIEDKSIVPEQLSRHQRRICVRHLLELKTYRQTQIAVILHIGKSTVTEIKHQIQRENSLMLEDLDERAVAADLIETADFVCAGLIRDSVDDRRKLKEAWNVKKELMEALQALGFLKRTPIEFKGELSVQEILKLANSPDTEDETFLNERAGQGRKNFITNGAS